MLTGRIKNNTRNKILPDFSSISFQKKTLLIENYSTIQNTLSVSQTPNNAFSTIDITQKDKKQLILGTELKG
jgi:hypothetical protein